MRGVLLHITQHNRASDPPPGETLDGLERLINHSGRVGGF